MFWYIHVVRYPAANGMTVYALKYRFWYRFVMYVYASMHLIGKKSVYLRTQVPSAAGLRFMISAFGTGRSV